MAKWKVSKSFTAEGTLEVIYSKLAKKLSDLNFVQSSSVWPSRFEFKRGKAGILAKNLKEVRTVLIVSLKQVSVHVNVSFEYAFDLPSAFVDKHDNEIEREFKKISDEFAGIVPPIKNSNVPREFFGQKDLDELLGGGIPNNSSMLITSPTCEEKDLIITKFIESGFEKSEPVIFVTTNDLMKDNQLANENQKFYRIICGVLPEVRRTSKTSKKYSKVRSFERLSELNLALDETLNDVLSNSDNQNPRRVILTILSDVLLVNHALSTRKWLRETITKFVKNNFTVLCILNPQVHSEKDVQSLLDLFDGQIDLYEKDAGANTILCMRIKRMKNIGYSTREVVLDRSTM